METGSTVLVEREKSVGNWLMVPEPSAGSVVTMVTCRESCVSLRGGCWVRISQTDSISQTDRISHTTAPCSLLHADYQELCLCF